MQGSLPEQHQRHGLPATIAVRRRVKRLATADGRQRAQQADARGRLRDKHEVHAAGHAALALLAQNALYARAVHSFYDQRMM